MKPATAPGRAAIWTRSLFQRASIVTGFAWLTAVSARALQRVPATAPPDHH